MTLPEPPAAAVAAPASPVQAVQTLRLSTAGARPARAAAAWSQLVAPSRPAAPLPVEPCPPRAAPGSGSDPGRCDRAAGFRSMRPAADNRFHAATRSCTGCRHVGHGSCRRAAAQATPPYLRPAGSSATPPGPASSRCIRPRATARAAARYKGAGRPPARCQTCLLWCMSLPASRSVATAVAACTVDRPRRILHRRRRIAG